MPTKDRCLRCGGPAAEGVAVCSRCNPAGLPAPSSTQYHGTVFLVRGREHGVGGGDPDRTRLSRAGQCSVSSAACERVTSRSHPAAQRRTRSRRGSGSTG